MQARHYIFSFFLLIAVGSLTVHAEAQQKAPAAKAAPAAAQAPPQCPNEATEIRILMQEVNNYRTQVARLATAVESARAELAQLKGPAK